MDNQLLHRIQNFTGLFRLRPMAVLMGTLLLAACQTTVSLEEARQITASFEGASFTPPPKTINDVVALLDEQKPADPEAVEKARETATREPPLGAKGDDLASFFWQRGTAAGKTGDVKRQIGDLKKALHHAEWADKKLILQELSQAEALGGNFADSIRHLEEASKDRLDDIAESETELAMLYARSGDLDAAERHLRLAYSSTPSVSILSMRGQFVNAARVQKSLSQTKAVILDASGRNEEAEFAYRSALTLTEEFVQRFAPDDKVTVLSPARCLPSLALRKGFPALRPGDAPGAPGAARRGRT